MKTILFLLALVTANGLKAQVFATSQNTISNNASCVIDSCHCAADNDVSTGSKLFLNTMSAGSFLSQNLQFSNPGVSGEYIGVVVEDLDLQSLNAALLAGVELTTYKAGISNADTKNSSQFVLKTLPGSTTRFILEFLAGNDFDQIQLKLNSGISGALDKIRIYYSYYSPSPLPVDLVSFNSEVENNKVIIRWTTAKEVNNNYFIVERSTNAVDFEAICKIPSKGSNSEIKYYDITDVPSAKGIYYYRLKHSDINAGFKYGNVLSVEFDPQNKEISLYPNPNEGKFSLSYSIKENDKAEFVIYNNSGKKVSSHPITPFSLSMDFNSDLENGVYCGRFFINSELTSSQKFIVK